jgi:serine/threonine-protein kinase HipA
MTSEPERAYVWVWLPGRTEPVVCGVMEAHDGGIVSFAYAQSYVERSEAVPLFEPELPLRRGRIYPPDGMRMAGVISDAAPDAWGQRVILWRRTGGRAVDTGELGMLTYLLESGSDRIGALDFQHSPKEYVPRLGSGTLDELAEAARRLEEGAPLSPELELALVRGTSVGGARPKALVDGDDRRMIAKFSSTTDSYPVVKAEAVAMELAARAGLEVAPTDMTEVAGRDVLLVERFDRGSAGTRRMLVSALTLAGLDEMAGRYATYHGLADSIRQRFTDPDATLRELFSRIVFNIAVGNTDDHARNHAAFWDGAVLTLTPAYDICPQLRAGGETAQAMAIGRDGVPAFPVQGVPRPLRDLPPHTSAGP